MGCNPITYSGFNEKTAKNIQFDAGSYFKNFDIDTDTYATAKAAGKLLGATQGGGSFSAVPTMRDIEVDGVKGSAKGLSVLDTWEVMMSMNLLELNKENIAAALVTGTITEEDFYDKIEAGNYICDENYIENITFVGRISGTQKPMIIQIFNAINTNGLSITSADNAEGVVALEFKAHYDATDLDTVPFVIYYPKGEGTITGTVTDTGTPVEGATVTLTIGTTTFTTTTAATTGAFTLTNIPYGTDYTITATKATKIGNITGVDVEAGDTTAAGAIAIV